MFTKITECIIFHSNFCLLATIIVMILTLLTWNAKYIKSAEHSEDVVSNKQNVIINILKLNGVKYSFLDLRYLQRQESQLETIKL